MWEIISSIINAVIAPAVSSLVGAGASQLFGGGESGTRPPSGFGGIGGGAPAAPVGAGQATRPGQSYFSGGTTGEDARAAATPDQTGAGPGGFTMPSGFSSIRAGYPPAGQKPTRTV